MTEDPNTPADSAQNPQDAPGPDAGTEAAGRAAEAQGAAEPAATTGQHSAAAPADPDGLRAWVAQIDRKLGTRTYAGAAAAVLALAAAIVAIVLAIDARDNSATKGELNRLEAELTSVSDQASDTEGAVTSLESLEARLTALEQEVEAISTSNDDQGKRIGVLENDVEDLRQQISELDTSGSGGSGGSG